MSNKRHKNLNVWLSEWSLAGLGDLLHVSHSSPVATLRSTENWVRSPLKETTDANKLFFVHDAEHRAAPNTKLYNFAGATSNLDPSSRTTTGGLTRARLGRFSAGVWSGAARKRRRSSPRIQAAWGPLSHPATQSVSCCLFIRLEQACIVSSFVVVVFFPQIGLTWLISRLLPWRRV